MTKEHDLKDTSWMMAASGHERTPGMHHCSNIARWLYGLGIELNARLWLTSWPSPPPISSTPGLSGIDMLDSKNGSALNTFTAKVSDMDNGPKTVYRYFSKLEWCLLLKRRCLCKSLHVKLINETCSQIQIGLSNRL